MRDCLAFFLIVMTLQQASMLRIPVLLLVGYESTSMYVGRLFYSMPTSSRTQHAF